MRAWRSGDEYQDHFGPWEGCMRSCEANSSGMGVCALLATQVRLSVLVVIGMGSHLDQHWCNMHDEGVAVPIAVEGPGKNRPSHWSWGRRGCLR